jgi:hypothetical protein
MAVAVRAADLPEGSIVAQAKRVFHKTVDDLDLPWIYAEAGSMYVNNASDDEVDDALDGGATVLRHGYGEEQP